MRERSIAIPIWVFEAIEQLAAEHGRSVNREIVQALKEWIKQHENGRAERMRQGPHEGTGERR